mmetsp:Transcript_49026/g.138735  ORF Transcript_49026/g.138735 Transcript_49026/m.138735 type:complete len:163 (-) Transcript_49026:47-535(-)|eukprot:CAMPEP_0119481282 /NCGR_PEP_ID=MMETSP1344-20130328/9695_1 /TAXON_ID=236787 /ORGANISM="Florenciella parvula, Strain CCMP2471" /LENGTH=162 /DNA_ID=CAMNT_0007515649 /DNA_START=294 /DNA_END=782 /DNA_ORIENTATION=+
MSHATYPWSVVMMSMYHVSRITYQRCLTTHPITHVVMHQRQWSCGGGSGEVRGGGGGGTELSLACGRARGRRQRAHMRSHPVGGDAKRVVLRALPLAPLGDLGRWRYPRAGDLPEGPAFHIPLSWVLSTPGHPSNKSVEFQVEKSNMLGSNVENSVENRKFF